eukprot:2721221-Rhodomonas_salina.1
MQYHSDKEAVVSEMTALMESVKAPVMAVDQWGMILQWNSMMEDLTKHSKDSVRCACPPSCDALASPLSRSCVACVAARMDAV